MKKRMLIGAAVSVAASLGLWLGLGGGLLAHANARHAATSSAEIETGPDTDNVQSGDQSTPDTPAAAVALHGRVHGQRQAHGESNSQPGRGRHSSSKGQARTQSESQAGGAETGSEPSSGSESESETSGEPGEPESSSESDGPGGHADPPGDVNHECTGDCQE
jgi:hypothetical protein